MSNLDKTVKTKKSRSKSKNTKSKNSPKTKNTPKKKKTFSNEAVGIIGIFIGLLFYVFLISNSVGYIGEITKKYIWLLTGFGGYFIPMIIIITGILVLANKIDSFKKSLVLLFLIFLCYLMIMDITAFGDNTSLGFSEKIKVAKEAGINLKGGGIVGGILSYALVNLFGVIGTFVVLSCIIIVTFITLTNVSLVKISRGFFKTLGRMFKRIYDSILDFVFVYEEVPDNIIEANVVDDATDKIDTEPSKIEQITEIEKKIEILDYTKDMPKFDMLAENAKNNINNNKPQIPKASEDKDKTVVINPANSTNIYDNYQKPDIEFLEKTDINHSDSHQKSILSNANKLETTLKNFGVDAKVKQINRGPTITRYELQPAPGIKVSKIVNLANDIALSLAASGVRIEAPIPGKAAVGIEVPNKVKDSVRIRDVIESKEFKSAEGKLSIALGKDIAGKSIIANIEKMPHMLIAGATGSGKSVCVNTLIASILYKAKPNEVKLMMIDPKVVELSIYNGIPHLLIPVVTDPKKAASALNWAVTEMINRYNSFAENGVRDIKSYNQKMKDTETENMPQIVIIIDELADLMMASPTEVEDSICRLAQMARAAGIHLIVATQRPSVDVITGTIKANIPSRLSFAVSSQSDSRIILDMNGAEKLLGKGDMLYYPVGSAKPMRVQCSYIDDKEVEKIVEFLKKQGQEEYKEEIIKDIETNIALPVNEDADELLPKAIELVINEGQASISYIQRKLRVGYARAARIVDEMEERGIVGPKEGSKPRKVLVSKEEYAESDA
ncbi:DNA translocase FtsK 4TM domain-containing protein [Clostridiaceae bacterium M8S5]|nr:DNA translocase FtsK 4TM domain-containing protein [Clostridiaceae bacterium M8S5]